MDLGQILAQSAPYQNQTPATTPGPDLGFEQKKQDWVSALNEMVQKPENIMMMLSMSQGLFNSGGQDFGAALSNSMMQGLGTRQQYLDRQAAAAQGEREEDRANRRLDIDSRRVDYEGERAELARQQQGWEQGTKFSTMTELERARNRAAQTTADAAMIRAQRPEAEGSAAQLQMNEREELIQALMQEEGIPRHTAIVEIQRREKGSDAESRAQKVFTAMMQGWRADAMNSIIGQPLPPKPTYQEALTAVESGLGPEDFAQPESQTMTPTRAPTTPQDAQSQTMRWGDGAWPAGNKEWNSLPEENKGVAYSLYQQFKGTPEEKIFAEELFKRYGIKF